MALLLRARQLLLEWILFIVERRGESNSHDKVDEGQLFHYEKRRVVNNFTTNCDLIILAM